MARGKSPRRRGGFFSGGRSAARREQHNKSLRGFQGRGLRVEPLEDRRMLAVFVVTNPGDLDMDANVIDGSLRWAVEQSNDNDEADTIVFSDFITDIFLEFRDDNGGQLEIEENLQILGPGSRKLTVNAAPGERLFSIDDGDEDERINVTFSRMTLSGGSANGTDEDGEGGTIRNVDSLNVIDSVISGGSATTGGGIFVGESGSLNLTRSVMSGNNAGFGGAIGVGGIGEDAGDDEGERNASVSISNSTLTGNSAGRGGALYVRDGTANVQHSTITGNTAGGFMGQLPAPAEGEDPVDVVVYGGGGIFGRSYFETDYVDPMTDPEPPDSQVSITITHSIVWGNMAGMDGPAPNDISAFPAVGDYGMAELVTSDGFNIVGADTSKFAPGAGDQIGVDPLLSPMSWYGGETNVFLPMEGSPAIDAGDPSFGGDVEQRGTFFSRVFDGNADGSAIVDIGASEVQDATFLVDELFDEFDDGQYIRVNLGFGFYETGDFAIREAIDFSAANPGLDTISFNDVLTSRPDPTPSADPTVYLTGQEPLTLDHSVNVVGAPGFTVEIDASGNDPTRGLNNGDGTAVFVTEQPALVMEPVDVRIEKLTVMGGDLAGFGGGVQANTNLQVVDATLKDNFATEVGGGLFIQFGELNVESSTFTNNTAGSDGGAIFVAGNFDSPSTGIIANSTISGNTAGSRGGGVANEYSVLKIHSSTITQNNAASTRGSGVASMFSDFGTITEITGSIISGNRVSDIDFFQGSNNIVSLGYNLIGGGTAIPSFNQPGDITDVFDPMLHPLANTGGPTVTHYPLEGSPVIDAGPMGTTSLITPVSVLSSTAADDNFDAANLIDDSGLDGVPTDENLEFITHAQADEFNAWSTDTSAGPGMDYFDAGIRPELVFSLDGAKVLSSMQIWGYPNPGLTGEEARLMLAEFSIDGGATYYASTRLTSPGAGEELRQLNFSDAFLADTVRVTVIDNFFGFPDPTVFPPTDPPTLLPGGSRVGLGEVKFLGYDQRGPGFLRVADGDEDGEARQDIGAYELQRLTLRVPNMSLPGAIDLSNRNPLADTIVFSPSGSFSTGGATITDTTTVVGNGPFFTQLVGPLSVDDGDDGNLIDVEISGVQFSGASGERGGLTTRENVMLDDVRVIGNSTTGMGAGINHALGELTINDSTITGNRATEVGSQGGGLFATDAVVHITGYTSISGNSTLRTQGHGGGVAVHDSYLLVDNGAVITGNITPAGESDGGGIYAVDSTVVLAPSTVVSGNTTTGSNSEGGGIYARNSDVFLSDVFLNLNTTTGTGAEGGGIYLQNSTAEITGSLIAQNRTLGAESSGGAIFAKDSQVTILNSGLVTNSVSGVGAHGGGVYSVGGLLHLDSSEVSENTTGWANSRGGGIYSSNDLSSDEQITRITNSTVSGNSARWRGGGIFNAQGQMEIWHSTITDNAVPFKNVGAGVASFGTPSSTQTLIGSSIVAGNQAVASGDATDLDSVDGVFQNSFASAGYNLIGTGNSLPAFSQSGDQTNVLNPMLEPLALNGGPTRTHAMLEGSPAVNAGDPNFNPINFVPPVDFDQRGAGFDRVLQGRIDVGAFESNFTQTGPADFNEDGVTEGFDFLMWQRGFGIASGASKAEGDANGDGAVDGADKGIWEATFGTTGPVISSGVASEAASAEASLAAASVVPQAAPEVERVIAADRSSRSSASQLTPAPISLPRVSDSSSSLRRDRDFSPAVREQLLTQALLLTRDQGIDRWAESGDQPRGPRDAFAPASAISEPTETEAEEEAFSQIGEQSLRSLI